MAFVPFAVTGASVDGLPHVAAINVLIAQLIDQVNQFNADETKLARFEALDGTATVVTTPAALAVLNPAPIMQSVTENQLTGQLAIALSLPIKNVATATGVLTSPRIAFGEDDGL